MSKQIGLIKVKGSLDGVSFYQSEGENFVRMSKGPSKKRILTDPAFKRTRENNVEFGASAKVAKALRVVLTPVIKMAEKRITSRIVTVFKSINIKGSGARGQRTIEVSKFGSELEKFELNSTRPLASVFKAPVNAEHIAARNTASIVIPAFNPAEVVTPVPGATHFRLIHVLGVVSDYSFIPATGKYEPMEPKLDTLHGANYSDYITLEKGVIPEMTITVELPGLPTMSAKTGVVQGLGILYYQSLVDGFYPLKQADAFKIIAVF